MKHTRAALLGIMTALLPACGGGDPGQVGSSEQSIVRGTVENGRPQVVALTITTPTIGRFCSGTYIAPRVVLTAAHCLVPPENASILVYHGNNYQQDYQALTVVPPPGTDSPWAQADSWQMHPDYNPAIHFPDLGIVYLDRELPFEPLPLGIWRLTDRQIGELGEVVGYGALKATSADIQTNEGVGVKRSGHAPFMGSPPQYPKPVDPHPGLDIAQVRAGLAMFNGTDPYPNACAGDSGGPVIMKRGRKEYTFGVSVWTADYCEGFAYYMRIDPFLHYFGEALERAGLEPLRPALTCVSPTTNGQLRAHFGYKNENGISLDVPYGNHNQLAADTSGVRPTHFKPADHNWVFGLNFAADARLSYKLGTPHGLPQELRVDARSQRCDPNDINFLADQICELTAPLACGADNETCVKENADTSLYMPDNPECIPSYTEVVRCGAALPLEKYSCYGDIAYGDPDTCLDEWMAWYTCMGWV